MDAERGRVTAAVGEDGDRVPEGDDREKEYQQGQGAALPEREWGRHDGAIGEVQDRLHREMAGGLTRSRPSPTPALAEGRLELLVGAVVSGGR